MIKWAAGFYYDEGRLGQTGCHGFKSREEAIAWLEHGFDWKRCWFMMPSVWLRSYQSGEQEDATSG